jgi:hypothetical protein
MSFNRDWERAAESWIAWARTPSHDEYWLYRDAFFELVHPLADAGCFAAAEADAPFVIDGSYLGRRRFEGTFERDGLEITFRVLSGSVRAQSRTRSQSPEGAEARAGLAPEPRASLR